MGDRGKRRKKSKKTDECPELPQEIVLMILMMIPADCLLTFRFVCKCWNNLISSPAFIRSHTLLSKERDSNLLLRCPNPFFKSQTIPISCLFDNSVKTSYDLFFPIKNINGGGMLVGSCRGIVCLGFEDGSVVLWNPCTRECEILPNSGRFLGSGSYPIYGFGYCDSIDKFVVVCLYTYLDEFSEYVTGTEVCNSKIEGWRRIKDFPFGTPFYSSGKFAIGSLCWLASKEPAFNLGIFFDNNSPWVVMAFDVEKETYSELVAPRFVGDSYDLTLGTLKESLSILCNYGNDYADFWVLPSLLATWTKLFTIPYTDSPSSFQYSSPLFISTNGDVIVELDSQIILYTRKDNKTKVLQINNFGGCLEADVYIKSLISPKMEHLKNVAAELEVKRKVPDSKADKLDIVKKTIPEFKVDKLSTVNKSCNKISVKLDIKSIGDGAVVPFQMKTNSPETVQPTFSAKEKELSVADKEEELSVAAFRDLLSKRNGTGSHSP